MSTKKSFDQVSLETSKTFTRHYSTSFSIGIRCMHRDLRGPIYSIYGFVRLADEIVDSFHGFDKASLLGQLKKDLRDALLYKISLNPILNSFQETVTRFRIDFDLIEKFLESMETDIDKTDHSQESIEKYILGSAEVVGLMCLRVFVEGNDAQYEKLKEPAMKLGAAFQKVNFLRDFQNDFEVLGRCYFPNLDIGKLNHEMKEHIIRQIESDFAASRRGISELPPTARLGVTVAFNYYLNLLTKIKKAPVDQLLTTRIRLSGLAKLRILGSSYLQHRTGGLAFQNPN